MVPTIYPSIPKVEKKKQQVAALIEMQHQLVQLKKLKELQQVKNQLENFKLQKLKPTVNPDELETMPMELFPDEAWLANTFVVPATLNVSDIQSWNVLLSGNA